MGAENTADRSDNVDSSAVAEPDDSGTVVARPDQLAAGPLAGLLVALTAGAVCWLILETFFPVFTIPDRLANLPPLASVEDSIDRETASHRALSNNAILFVTILGVFVGGGLAASEAVARRLGWFIPAAVLAGAAVGALFGSLAGLAGNMAFDLHQPIGSLSPLAKTVRSQAVMLGILGAGIGLAMGLLSGCRRTVLTCVVGGLLSGVLAGIVYPMLAAVCLPMVATELVVPPQRAGRLLWIGVLTGLLGVTIPGVARQRPKRMRCSDSKNEGKVS